MTHDHILKRIGKVYSSVFGKILMSCKCCFRHRDQVFFSDEAREVLKQVKKWWDIYGDGPIVSMGIGYVIHLLFRKDQMEMKKSMLSSLNFIDAIEGTYPIKETEQAQVIAID